MRGKLPSEIVELLKTIEELITLGNEKTVNILSLCLPSKVEEHIFAKSIRIIQDENNLYKHLKDIIPILEKVRGFCKQSREHEKRIMKYIWNMNNYMAFRRVTKETDEGKIIVF